MNGNITKVASSSSSEMKKCFTLLEEGERIIRTDQKDAILVIGNTGSGKTTLIQFVTGDNSQLFAEEAAQNSGDYIIMDKNNKTSSDSTVISKTLFPELIFDGEHNVGFYDCMGFDDSRGTAVEIAGMYFIRKIINSIDRVKIILTVNYSSVRTGIDRSDFLEMIRHVLHLIKNIDKYCDSFSIVVTKVENTYVKNKKTKENELVSDSTIRNYIAKFLQTFKDNVVKITDESFSSRAVKLIDCLLSKNGAEYEKIGIFRRPNEEGSLDKSKLLQEGKRYIRKMLVDAIQFARVYPNDFGYAISDKSKNEVKELVEKIDEIIKMHIMEICAELETNINAKDAQVKDIATFSKFLSEIREKIESFKGSVEYENNLKDFIRKLLNLIADLRVNVSRRSFLDILKQGKYLDFLELVSERKVDGSSSKWRGGFQYLSSYLGEMQEWYNFLNTFYQHLSSYEVQRLKQNFTYLMDHQITSLGDEKLKQFIQKQPSFNLTSIQETMTLDTFQILTLNNIISSTLNTSVSIKYDQELNSCTIYGEFVVISQIDDKYLSSSKNETINIFASNTIFLDKNITRINKELANLVMIAPTWEIVGVERIVLDGKDGEVLPQAVQSYRVLGSDGNNGRPGFPGNAAANFFGIGINFVNSEELVISTNGGHGGPGQNGADGLPGKDGNSPLKHNSDGTCRIGVLDWFNWEHTNGLIFRKYCSYGERGNPGGNGGNGGVGGYGGHPGNVMLVGLHDHKPLASILKNNGFRGVSGQGGKAGAGGKAGKSINTKGILFWWNDIDCSESDHLAREYGACSADDYLKNGEPGHNGYPGEVVTDMEFPTVLKQAEKGVILRKYKEFLRHCLIHDNVKQNEKLEFLRSLEENASLTEAFTVKDLVAEFIELENEYLNLNREFNWSWHYEQLLRLVEVKSSSTSNEDKQPIFEALQKAIVSKLCLLKAKPQKIVIKQVPEYLDSVKVDLNNLIREDERLLSLNDSLKKMHLELSKTTKELNSRTEQNGEKIAHMSTAIWSHIKKLVDEIVTDENIKNKEEKESMLEQNLTMLKVLHGTQGVIQLLNSMNSLVVNIIKADRSRFKYMIRNDEYAETILKMKEILLQVALADTRALQEQFSQISTNLMDDQQIPNNIKRVFKHFTDIKINTENIDKIFESGKLRQDLLKMVTDETNEKPENLSTMFQIIEAILHVKDITILAIGDKTSPNRAHLLKTIFRRRAYDHIQFYFEKLSLAADQLLKDISKHLVDEIVDVTRVPKERLFNDINLLLQQLHKSVKLPEDLTSVLLQVQIDLQTMSTTYNSLSYYQEFDRLVNMIKSAGKLSSGPISEIGIINSLNEITESNLVLDQYQLMLQNMNQIVFPFGNLYSEKFSIYDDVSVKNITNFAVHKLQTMKSSVEKQGLYLDPDHAKLVFEGDFVNEKDALGAFYVWRNEDHKLAIEDLFTGKEVTLKADIIYGIPNNAVKFNSIRIKFVCKDQSLQHRLEEDLNNFEVTMIHGEDSFYRCGNEFYRFSFDRQSYSFSFRTNLNGEPVVKNVLYGAIKNGAAILSPYTQWRIQLNYGNFEKLAQYKNMVDIELEGLGTYVKNGENLCGNTLQNYYTADSSISETNGVENDVMDLSKVQLRVTKSEPNTTLPQLHRVVRSLNKLNRLTESKEQNFFDMKISLPGSKSLLGQNTFNHITMINKPRDQNQVKFCASSEYNINNCLMLLDLLVRRFTRVKPTYFDQCSASFLQIKMCAVDVVKNFEKIVETVCDYEDQYDIDPVPLMELITKDIINENGKNVVEILLKSVQSNNSPVSEEFYTHLRAKTAKDFSLNTEFGGVSK